MSTAYTPDDNLLALAIVLSATLERAKNVSALILGQLLLPLALRTGAYYYFKRVIQVDRWI